MTISNYLVSASFAFLALSGTVSATTEACLPTNKRKNGMNINFYEYALGDTSTYANPAYMAYEYANTTKIGSVTGQTSLSIYYNPPCSGTPTCSDDDSSSYPYPTHVWDVIKRENQPCYNVVPSKRDTTDCDPYAAYWSSDLFGFYTSPTNITVEMTGYFLPPESGDYTFTFGTADDSAVLSVGGEAAFRCCDQQSSVKSTSFTVDGVGSMGGPTIEGSVYMLSLIHI